MGRMWSGDTAIPLSETLETVTCCSSEAHRVVFLMCLHEWLYTLERCPLTGETDSLVEKEYAPGSRGGHKGLMWQKIFLYLWSLGFRRAELLRELSNMKGIYLIRGSEHLASESPWQGSPSHQPQAKGILSMLL